jgi:hypothetical protein
MMMVAEREDEAASPDRYGLHQIQLNYERIRDYRRRRSEDEYIKIWQDAESHKLNIRVGDQHVVLPMEYIFHIQKRMGSTWQHTLTHYLSQIYRPGCPTNDVQDHIMNFFRSIDMSTTWNDTGTYADNSLSSYVRRWMPSTYKTRVVQPRRKKIPAPKLDQSELDAVFD